MIFKPSILAPLGIIGLLISTSCSTGDKTAVASGALTTRKLQALTVVDGDNQSAVVGSTLKPFLVKVASPEGQAIEGEIVFFSVEDNFATLSASSAITDGDGIASTVLTLGSRSGAGKVIAKGISTQPTPIAFIAAPSDPFTLIPDAVTPHATDESTLPLVRVRLVDSFLNGIPNANIVLTPPASGLTLAQTQLTTDASGYATTELTSLTAAPGVYSVNSRARDYDGVQSKPIVVGVVAGAPSQIRFDTSDTFTQQYCTRALKPSVSGSTLSTLRVVVEDSLGNPLPTVGIRFSFENNSSLPDRANTITDSNGHAGAVIRSNSATPRTDNLKAEILGTNLSVLCTLEFI